MLALYVSIAVVFALEAGLLAFLAWAYSAPRFASRRISPMPPLRVGMAARTKYFAMSSTLSLVLIFGLTYALFGFAITDRALPWWRTIVDPIVVILTYDFLYYFLHRLMHHKRLVRLVHAVHHRALNPSALESFYLHPVELIAGLVLLHSCLALYALVMGPIAIAGYAVLFFFHSALNILVHSGIQFGGVFAPIDYLARKHSVHHKDDSSRNYSSLTPLPDMLFGTSG